MRRFVGVWLALVVLTLVSWEVPQLADVSGAIILVVIGSAVIKTAIIGLEFIELRHAFRGLRLAFLAWTVVVGIALVAVLASPA